MIFTIVIVLYSLVYTATEPLNFDVGISIGTISAAVLCSIPQFIFCCVCICALKKARQSTRKRTERDQAATSTPVQPTQVPNPIHVPQPHQPPPTQVVVPSPNSVQVNIPANTPAAVPANTPRRVAPPPPIVINPNGSVPYHPVNGNSNGPHLGTVPIFTNHPSFP